MDKPPPSEIDKSSKSLDATSDGAADESKVPRSRVIGPYKLLQPIGEGGMGSVWVAQQDHPVRRRVAVKLIKAGNADKRILARFDAERQALAMMDHPNIAKILDAGTSGDGAPFFVMELVHGERITDYCDRHELSLRERLQLFVPVCHAIQHAHQKGIIHRDLKPSNILVGMHDGQAVPKVIDFGLAKALQHQKKLNDGTLFTEVGQVLGTVRYMSPEQASLDALDIDTRTDIYSLGVVLYELITGSTPIDEETVRSRAILQVLELIREKDPPRPSDRLSSSDAQLPDVCKQRRIQPSRLRQVLRGDLDWIIMRALEKDRGRRYESANHFADDIQRFLDGDAVEARPPTASYRVGKLVRKHRGLVAAGMMILGVVIAGVIISTRFALSEKAARATAEAAARRSADVLGIVVDSFGSVDPRKGADADMLAKEALLNAQDTLEASELDDAGKAELLSTLTNCFLNLGEFDEAKSTATDQIAIQQDLFGPSHAKTLRSMYCLGQAYQAAGQLDEALRLFEETRAAQAANQGEQHPDTLATMNTLAMALHDSGRREEALALYQQTLSARQRVLGLRHPDTLESMHNLAYAYFNAGRYDESIELYETTLAAEKSVLGGDHPATLNTLGNLAYAYSTAGRKDEALPMLEQAVEAHTSKLGPEHPTTLVYTNNLAHAYRASGQFERALALFEKLVDSFTKQLGDDHPNTLTATNGLALVFTSTGRLDEAQALYEKTLATRRQISGPDHPSTLTAQVSLAYAYYLAERLDMAIPLYEQAVEMMSAKLGDQHPKTLASRNHLARAYRTAGNWAVAQSAYQRLIDDQKSTLGPSHPSTLKSMLGMTRTFIETGALTEAGELLNEIMKTSPTEGPDRGINFYAQSLQGEVLVLQERVDEAVPLLRSSYEGLKQAVVDNASVRNWYVAALERLLKYAQTQGDPAEAERLQSELESSKDK